MVHYIVRKDFTVLSGVGIFCCAICNLPPLTQEQLKKRPLPGPKSAHLNAFNPYTYTRLLLILREIVIKGYLDGSLCILLLACVIMRTEARYRAVKGRL